MMRTFETVWQRIGEHAGEVFRQIQGGEFRYAVRGEYVIPDRSNYPIPKAHFRIALERAPLRSTAVLQDLRGPSYLYAILMDDRVRPIWDSGTHRPAPPTRTSPTVPPQPSVRAEPSSPADLILEGLAFTRVSDLDPAKGQDGRYLEFMPQAQYPKAATTRLHRYGQGPFCKFSIPTRWSGASGVYAILVDGVIRYVGKCVDLARRFNLGYGNIAPINCYEGGQSTNCKINNLVLRAVQSGSKVELYFTQTRARHAAEAQLIQSLRPEWNGRL